MHFKNIFIFCLWTGTKWPTDQYQSTAWGLGIPAVEERVCKMFENV